MKEKDATGLKQRKGGEKRKREWALVEITEEKGLNKDDKETAGP